MTKANAYSTALTTARVYPELGSFSIPRTSCRPHSQHLPVVKYHQSLPTSPGRVGEEEGSFHDKEMKEGRKEGREEGRKGGRNNATDK